LPACAGTRNLHRNRREPKKKSADKFYTDFVIKTKITMTWIIIILLALILVALMNSNQNSAQAVKKVIKFVAIGALVMAVWLLLLGVMIWANSLNNPGTWSYAAIVALVVLIPPAVVWLNLKEIREAFETDSKAATKRTLKIGGYVALMLSVMVTFQLLKKEGLDVFASMAVFTVTGMILISRSLARPEFKREIWFGLDEPKNIQLAMSDARRKTYAKEDATRKDEAEIWGNMTESERESVRAVRAVRAKESEIQLQVTEASLKAQHESWNKQSLWSVHYVFWLASTVLGLSILGKVWEAI
jgi:hypothetical protein